MKRLKMSSKINKNELPVRTTDPEFIGLCKHLDKFDVLALSYFRLWYNGNEGRKKAERDFTINLGYVEGYKATRSLGRLFELLLTQSKRKLISLPIGDARYNENERWFAELLASSVEESDKENFFFISRLLPNHVVPSVVSLAKDLGGAIKKSTVMRTK